MWTSLSMITTSSTAATLNLTTTTTLASTDRCEAYRDSDGISVSSKKCPTFAKYCCGRCNNRLISFVRSLCIAQSSKPIANNCVIQQQHHLDNFCLDIVAIRRKTVSVKENAAIIADTRPRHATRSWLARNLFLLLSCFRFKLNYALFSACICFCLCISYLYMKVFVLLCCHFARPSHRRLVHLHSPFHIC